MISQEELLNQEKISLTERINHIEKLLQNKENPRPLELGLLLALKMAEEIKEKKVLGEDSGNLVASWNGKYPDSIIEEAISCAKEFMLHPSSLMNKIKEGIINQTISSNKRDSKDGQ